MDGRSQSGILLDLPTEGALEPGVAGSSCSRPSCASSTERCSMSGPTSGASGRMQLHCPSAWTNTAGSQRADALAPANSVKMSRFSTCLRDPGRHPTSDRPGRQDRRSRPAILESARSAMPGVATGPFYASAAKRIAILTGDLVRFAHQTNGSGPSSSPWLHPVPPQTRSAEKASG